MRLILPLVISLFISSPVHGDPVVVAPPPHTIEFAICESSCLTDGDRIRQFAFDADPATYFASERNASKSDHFTITFDHPVSLKSVAVLTGQPGGTDLLTEGVLEVSGDGVRFEAIATFAEGKAVATKQEQSVKSVRIRATGDLKCPLVIREIVVVSEPKVVTFRYPIEFTLDVADTPEMKEWCHKVIRVCERHYSMICEELSSEGYRPPSQIHLTMKAGYNGVAEASGNKITGSVKFFKAHPDDMGAMVHETAHCVQGYRARNLPGWLVEGIADYIRFWKYEPGKAGRLAPEQAKFDGSYRTTTAFLAFVSENYDGKLVNKLNSLLRDGKYEVGVWKTLTGKTVEELNQEWRRSLAR